MGFLGVLAISRYDALVPAAWVSAALRPGVRSALVVASGRPALFEAFRAAPEAALAVDPLDAYTRRVVEAAAGGSQGFDVAACRATRVSESACRLRCDARRACVIGPDHAYSPEAEAHHMRASLET